MITYLKNSMKYEQNEFAKTGTIKVKKSQVTPIVSALNLKWDSAMKGNNSDHYYSEGRIPQVSEVYHLAVYKEYAELTWTVKLKD